MRRRCNCFVWAWAAFFKRGGYCALRKSRVIWGYHWLWSPDLVHWYQSAPLRPMLDEPQWLLMLHKFWFAGYIKRGDGD